MTNWLGLMIGNSRFHWAFFESEILRKTWDTPYFDPQNWEEQFQKFLPQETSLNSISPPPLWIASVVPEQTQLWQKFYPNTHHLTPEEIPLNGLYSTLGIDRALAVFGGLHQWGSPLLVIDGGTALTLTGIDEKETLIGGAILPGFRLQLSSLSQNTAALPLTDLPHSLPPRWTRDTITAMQSGIVYTLIAGIRDFILSWLENFPDSYIVITGGDRHLLLTYLSQLCFDDPKILDSPDVIFLGILKVKQIHSQTR